MRSVLVILGLLISTAASAQMVNSSGPQNQIPSTTVSALPSCTTALRGVRYIVTDSLTPVALAAPTGGGAAVVSVLCNGTGWIVQ